MSKEPTALSVADISEFARRLAPQLKDRDAGLSHLSLLNMLARAAGFQNYQHLRAARSAHARLTEVQAAPDVDFRLVERALQHFDAEGHLVRWPSRRPVQELCLWGMWSHLPAATPLNERQVSARLNEMHLFGDAALLRRSLVGMALLTRTLDGSDYRRLEKRPPDVAQELIARIKRRRGAHAVSRTGA